jgi:peptidoglycan/xylan/chitin deacetylase (PgdA/CDA1 family)
MNKLDLLRTRARSVITRHTPVKRVRSRLQRPTASFTFDDFPRSALHTAAPMMARHGGRATYYAAGRYCGAHEDGIEYYTADDLRAAHADGHEIACHSFGHVYGSGVTDADLSQDFERNAAFLRSTLGRDLPLTNYAFPYGDVSPRTKRLAGGRFASSRGIYPGVNAGMLELAQLKAVPLESRSWTPDVVERLVEQARESRGWIIFFSHDVEEQPSPFGATPDMLAHALDAVRAAGLDILTVKDALARAV